MEQREGAGAAAHRRELSAFLRAKRRRIRPGDVGLPATPRRRAEGLLREEVAQLAGIGVTWYTWLEQARPVNVSLEVLESVARALRLDAVERTHLLRLARPDLALQPPRAVSGTVPAALLETLHGMAPHPVYVVNARSDVLAWNHPAACVFGDFAVHPPPERNVMWLLLCDPVWRGLFEDWEAIAETAVAQFRASVAHLSADPGTVALLQRLRERSPVFASAWERQEVHRPPIRRKVLLHPQAGRLAFNYTTFQPQGTEEDLRFTVYTLVSDAPAAKRFERLLAGRRGA